MLEIIKSFFSPVGGGRTSFASQNGNIQGKEDLRQGRNLVSNSDFNRKRGEEYLISSSFVSENIVGGGQLRSNNYSASSRSIKGGEGNYTSLMSSDFADTKTMLNPNRIVGGGAKSIWIRLFRKGASHYLGRCVATSRACSLLMDASRMTSVLIHEMWKEVAD